MSLLLVGMSHRTATLALRERYAVDDPRPILTKLVAGPDVDEAVLEVHVDKAGPVSAGDIQPSAGAEVMDPGQMELMSEYVDIFQVGTRNMQNFSLLKALGRQRKIASRGYASEEMARRLALVERRLGKR